MTQRLRSVALSDDLVARALPLVQITWPGVDARAWRNYVQFLAGRTHGNEAGVVALGDSADYLNGLLIYEVEWDLQQGRVFTIHLFTAVDLANSLAPIRALLDAAATRATDLGCNGLRIRLHDGQAAFGSHLRSAGLSDRAGYLWKSIAPVQSAS